MLLRRPALALAAALAVCFVNGCASFDEHGNAVLHRLEARVVDSEGQPVTGALVQFKGGARWAKETTDDRGLAVFEVMRPSVWLWMFIVWQDIYEFHATKRGYLPVTKVVKYGSGEWPDLANQFDWKFKVTILMDKKPE